MRFDRLVTLVTCLLILGFVQVAVAQFGGTGSSHFIDPASPTDQGPPGSSLYFSDEFNGDELDLRKWALGRDEENRQLEGIVCHYTLDNLTLKDGKLVFVQRREKTPIEGNIEYRWERVSYDYSSGSIHTAKPFRLRNNMYVELRLKLPSNSGGYAHFDAISEPVRGSKPEDLLEIDFFEFSGGTSRRDFFSGLWWKDFRTEELGHHTPRSSWITRAEDHIFIRSRDLMAQAKQYHVSKKEYDFYDFITFGCKITNDQISWHIKQDGPAWNEEPYKVFQGGEVTSRAYDRGKAPSDRWIRDVPNPFYARVMLSYEMRDADWAGGPVDDSQLPAKMLVDYFRVYQLDQ